jgi:hypothetical protein
MTDTETPPAGNAERPDPATMAGTDDFAHEDMIVLRRGKNNKLGAFKIALTPLADITHEDITAPGSYQLVLKKQFERVLFNGEKTTVRHALWTNGGRLTCTYLLDVATWRGVMYPYFDSVSKDIRFRHASPPEGYGDVSETQRTNLFNFNMLIRPANFDCDFVLLVSNISGNNLTHGSDSGATYYMYLVKKPEKSGGVYKLRLPPLCNLFDDGKVCIRADVGLRHTGTNPDSILIDLQNASGNLHLQKTNSGSIIGSIVNEPSEGIPPYIEISCPSDRMANVSPNIPPVWGLWNF